MSKTVKRVLWQRTLETAGPLRKPLPAPKRLQTRFSQLMVTVEVHGKVEGFWRPIGMDFAQGGVLDQTIVRLVGERGPEVRLTIPAGRLKVGEPVFSWLVNPFLASLPQMVREINEAAGGCDGDVPR